MSLMESNSKNAILIISEIGLELSLDEVTEEQKKIFSEKIASKDSYLYNEKGELISDINQIFLSKEKEKYFLFNKKYDKEFVIKLSEDYFKKKISNYDSQLILDKNDLPDIYSNENLLLENSSKLKFIEVNDIKNTYEKMLEFFENYKNIYTSFKVNIHICEEIKKHFININSSINIILIENINKIINICEIKQKEAINETKKLSEIKEINLKILNDGLDNLKKYELHPLLQTKDKKYLIDIYFDIKNMEQVKDEYIKNEELNIKRLKEKNSLYTYEKNKFIKENGKLILDIQNDINNLKIEYDNKLKELINEPNIIYENLIQDFRFFEHSLSIIFDFLNSINSNNITTSQDEKAFNDSCEQINILKNKYNDFNSLNQLQTKLEPINPIILKMRKSFDNLSLKVNKIFNSLFNIHKNIFELSEKFDTIKKQTINLEECFNKFKNISEFPSAYENSLKEIKRRILFNMKIKKYFEKIEIFVKNEADLRKNFQSKYGIYLPQNSFSCLKNNEPKVKLDIDTKDEINEFPKLITEDEIDLLIENSNDKNLINVSLESGDILSKYNLEQKIKELNDKLIIKEKELQNKSQDLTVSINSYDNIFKNFVFILNKKDEEIKRLNQEKNNIITYINTKTKNNLENCPLCREDALSSEQINNFNLYENKMRNKILNYENKISDILEKYKNLVYNIIQVKKVFFNYMNNKISEYNLNNYNNINNNISEASSNNNLYYKELNEKINYNSNNIIYQNEIQNLKNILNEEKIKNNKLITDKNILITKYESLINDIKKIKNENEQTLLKLNSENAKINTLLKENEALKEEIIIKEKQKINNEKTILDLRQLVKQISEENNLNENKYNKEIIKIKNQSIIFKDIKVGDRCIFVPYSESVYVCINLTLDLNILNKDFYICDIILDFSCIEKDKKNLVTENNLIIIGTINELKEIIIKEGDVNPYEIHNEENEEDDNENNENENTILSTSINSCLKASHSYKMAKLKNIDYIIGFPDDKLCFLNYNSKLNIK